MKKTAKDIYGKDLISNIEEKINVLTKFKNDMSIQIKKEYGIDSYLEKETEKEFKKKDLNINIDNKNLYGTEEKSHLVTIINETELSKEDKSTLLSLASNLKVDKIKDNIDIQTKNNAKDFKNLQEVEKSYKSFEIELKNKYNTVNFETELTKSLKKLDNKINETADKIKNISKDMEKQEHSFTSYIFEKIKEKKIDLKEIETLNNNYKDNFGLYNFISYFDLFNSQTSKDIQKIKDFDSTFIEIIKESGDNPILILEDVPGYSNQRINPLDIKNINSTDLSKIFYKTIKENIVNNSEKFEMKSKIYIENKEQKKELYQESTIIEDKYNDTKQDLNKIKEYELSISSYKNKIKNGEEMISKAKEDSKIENLYKIVQNKYKDIISNKIMETAKYKELNKKFIEESKKNQEIDKSINSLRKQQNQLDKYSNKKIELKGKTKEFYNTNYNDTIYNSNYYNQDNSMLNTFLIYNMLFDDSNSSSLSSNNNISNDINISNLNSIDFSKSTSDFTLSSDTISKSSSSDSSSYSSPSDSSSYSSPSDSGSGSGTGSGTGSGSGSGCSGSGSGSGCSGGS